MAYRKIDKTQTELLEEYKARLISDVVTGKIDVRDFAIPEYEHIEDESEDETEDSDEQNEEQEV